MPTQSIARAILSTVWGAHVEPISTSTKQESDWLVTLDGFRLLVEEKHKFENPASIVERNDALESGEVHGTTTSLRPNNRISGIVQKATKQLRSTGADVKHDARVIWFNSVGFDRETKDYQAFNTLYGVTKVFDLDVGASLQDCFFFYNSEFFRHPDLDGAYLAVVNHDEVTVRLCLNPFSSHWQLLRDSPIAEKLVTGLVDPVLYESSGEAMIADTDIDRSDSEAVLVYLRQKYGIDRLLNMDMHMASAIISVPHERE